MKQCRTWKKKKNIHYIKAIREGTLIKEHISVVCAWNFASLKGSKKRKEQIFRIRNY